MPRQRDAQHRQHLHQSGLIEDYDDWLEKLAPHEPISHYRHNRTGEDNTDAHLKRQIMGREVVVAITNGKLDFARGSNFFTPSLMAVAKNACSSR